MGQALSPFPAPSRLAQELAWQRQPGALPSSASCWLCRPSWTHPQAPWTLPTSPHSTGGLMISKSWVSVKQRPETGKTEEPRPQLLAGVPCLTVGP